MRVELLHFRVSSVSLEHLIIFPFHLGQLKQLVVSIMEGTSGTMDYSEHFDLGIKPTVKSEPDDDEDIDINTLLEESENFTPSRFMEVFVNESSGELIDPELPADKDDTQATNEVEDILTPFSLNFADEINVSYEGEQYEEKKGICCVCGREEGDGSINIKFHEFPTDQTMFRRWKEVCQMRRSSSSLPVHQWRVCSKHFTFKDYVNRCGKVTLHAKAVPSVDMPNTPWRLTSPPSPEPSERFCCVCRQTGKANSSVTFHPFPKEKNLLKLWKERCGMLKANDATRNHWFVCSNHFIQSNFRYEKGVGYLLPTAVPSIDLRRNNSRGQQQGTREVKTCCVCHFTESVYSAITFYPFPLNKSMFNLWKEKCGVDEEDTYAKTLFVCSRHFVISDFNVVNGKQQLLPLAVPSVGLNPFIIQESPDNFKCYMCKGQGTGGKYTVSYHKFPSDADTCLAWKKMCNLSADADVSRLRICSRHFSRYDQYVSSNGVRCVMSGAVPCFNIPNVGSNPDSVIPISFPNNAIPKRLFVLSNATQSQVSQSTVVSNTSSSPANQKPTNNKVSSALYPNKSFPNPLSVGKTAAILATPDLRGAAPNRQSNLLAPNSQFFMMKDGSPVQRTANGKTVFVNLNRNKLSPAPITAESSLPPQYRVILPKSSNAGMRPTFQLALPYEVASMNSPTQNATVRSASSMAVAATSTVTPALKSMPLTATGTSVTKSTKTVPPKFEASSNSLDEEIKPISAKFRGGSVSKGAVSGSSNKRPLSREELLCTVRQPVVLLKRLAVSKDGKVVIPPKQKQQKRRYPKNKKQVKKNMKGMKLDWKNQKSGSVESIAIASHRSKHCYLCVGQSYEQKISPMESGDNMVNVEVKPGEDESGDTKGKEVDKITKSDTETNEEDMKRYCYVCSLDGRKGDGNAATLYRFPSMPGVCDKWKRICNVKDGDDVSTLRICSKHFRPDDFVQTKGTQQRGELILRMCSYPSLTVPNTEALAEIDKEFGPNMEPVVETPKRACFLCSYQEGQDKTKKITLYRFPTRGNTMYQWKQACNVYDHDYMDLSSLFVCTKHFTESDFTDVGGKMLALKPEAVPSVNVPNVHKASFVDIGMVSADSSTDSCDMSEEGVNPADLVEVTLNEPEFPVAMTTSDKSLLPTSSGGPMSTPQVCMSKEQMGGSKKTVVVKTYLMQVKNQSQVEVTSNEPESSVAMTSSDMSLRPTSSGGPVSTPQVCMSKEQNGGSKKTLLVKTYLRQVQNQSQVEVTSNEPESSVAVTSSDKSLFPTSSGGPMSTPQVCMSKEQIGGSKKTVKTYLRQAQNQSQNQKLATDRMLASYNPQSDNNKDTGAQLVTDRILASYNPRRSDNDKDKGTQLVTDRILAPYSPLRSDKDEVNQTMTRVSNYVSFPNSSLNTRHSYSEFQPAVSSTLSSSPDVCHITQTPSAATVSLGSLSQYQLVSPAIPPKLYVPTPVVKTVVHAGCQTLPTATPADKMCQTLTTAVFNSSADPSDKKRETVLPPPAKKQRVSPVETGLSASGRDLQPTENSSEKESDMAKKQLKSVQDLVIHLQQKSMLSQEAGDMIMSTLTDDIQELIASKLQSDGQGKLSADLRSFALTLHFFSTVAYNYVRNIWPNLLPDPSLIRNWFSVSDGKPGFTQEVLDDIYSKSKENGGSFPCCVFVCDLPIRREVFFEDGQFYGNVNLGTDQDMRQDGAFTAQTALVFFVSALHKTWCCPLGYFFISSLNAWERANVLTKCLDLLHEVYANVVSITIDGSPANISMCNCLGANFVYGKDWRPWFLDPVTQKKILVFWDTLKMLRLVRDALGDVGCIFTQDDKIIKWSALKWLVKFQTEIHPKVFTHLTKKHVEYQSDRTNVLLCRQVFSQNVCKAFRFARELQIPELRSANATDKFCMVFCHLFNLLSSENIFSRRECGSSVTELTRHFMLKSAESFVKYISGLKDATDVPILKSSRKIGFLGLVINLVNSVELFDVLSKIGVKQLLTAKLSHEYVELFSATIRQEVNGYLPNAKQFQDAYRKFVLKRAVRKIRLGPSTCLVDSIEMLHTISSIHKYPVRDFSDRISVGKFDSTFVSIVRMLNPLVSVEKYLYGFVVQKIISNGLCSLCAYHLTTERNIKKILMSKVSCLCVEPSSSVRRICQRTDSVFRELRTSILCGQCTKKMFVNQVFMSVCWDVFISSKMDEHVLEQGYLDNHRSQLCKLIIETLFDIRVFCEKAKGRKQR